jgi:hypothetical protein
MPVDKSPGLRSDQTRVLTGPLKTERYPAPLRRISFYAKDIDKRFFYRPSPSPRFIDSELPLTAQGSGVDRHLRPPVGRHFKKATSRGPTSPTICQFSPHPFSRRPPSRLCFSATKSKSNVVPPQTANSWRYSTFNRTAPIRNPKIGRLQFEIPDLKCSRT